MESIEIRTQFFKENVKIGNKKKDEEPCSTKELEES
jgi:hypothetical protein